MNAWRGLVDKTKSVLGRKPKPSMNAIRRTRMDELTYRDLTDEVPILNDLAYDLNEQHAYTGELVQDTFQGFYKDPPELLPATEMDARCLINHAVMETVQGLPQTAATREMTRYDIYGSALATSAMHDKLDEELTQSEQAEEVRQASEEAAAAQEAEQQAAADAQQTAAELEQACEDYDGAGPLTEAQQALADQLQQQLEAAQQATDAAGQARQATGEAVRQLQRQVRGKVAEAVKETHDQLQAEAELFAAWGIDDGQLKKMSFTERQDLARRLQANRLSQWRKLIGRYRQRAHAERSRKVRYGRDEVYEIELGGYLPDVLPTEFTRLATRPTRLTFLRDYARKSLLQRAWRGVEKIADGAVIALIDCSDSMNKRDVNGITREAWAKAVALSMLDQAHAAGRDCVLINFSSARQQQMWRFPAKQQLDLNGLMEWAEHMYAGGTNYEVPLAMATDVLEAEFNGEGKQKGDLVLLTDDECKVTPEWMAAFQARKRKLAFRVFGVAIGMSPGITLAALSDNVRGVEEFADPGQIADMYRTI